MSSVSKKEKKTIVSFSLKFNLKISISEFDIQTNEI